jgi:hypothetical protein
VFPLDEDSAAILEHELDRVTLLVVRGGHDGAMTAKPRVAARAPARSVVDPLL